MKHLFSATLTGIAIGSFIGLIATLYEINQEPLAIGLCLTVVGLTGIIWSIIELRIRREIRAGRR